MLKKVNRLGKTKDIKRTTMHGRSFFNPNFVIKFHPSQPSLPRFTVIITIRVSKKAVIRNKLKRIIRETIRTNLEHFRPGDYAIIVRTDLVKLPPKDIPALILSAMKRNHLYE